MMACRRDWKDAMRRGSIIVALTLSFAFVRGQQLEQTVKAAYIYNFTKYVEWPSGSFDNSGILVIGIIGSDAVAGELEKSVEGKSVGGKRIVVRHLRWGQDLAQCQVLFVPASEMSGASQLTHIKERPILTVGESPGFARRYGIINFIIESNRVRFEINAQSAKDAGLTISSKLLSLGRPPGG